MGSSSFAGYTAGDVPRGVPSPEEPVPTPISVPLIVDAELVPPQEEPSAPETPEPAEAPIDQPAEWEEALATWEPIVEGLALAGEVGEERVLRLHDDLLFTLTDEEGEPVEVVGDTAGEHPEEVPSSARLEEPVLEGLVESGPEPKVAPRDLIARLISVLTPAM